MTCKGYKTKCYYYTPRKSYQQCQNYNRKQTKCQYNTYQQIKKQNPEA